jgi:hypothetical protein
MLQFLHVVFEWKNDILLLPTQPRQRRRLMAEAAICASSPLRRPRPRQQSYLEEPVLGTITLMNDCSGSCV